MKLILSILLLSLLIVDTSNASSIFKLKGALKDRAQRIENGESLETIPNLPGEGSGSIYNKLISWLSPKFRTIGKRQTDAIFYHNQNYNLGSQNLSSIAWQRPMGIFNIGANRGINPAPGKKFKVSDVFTISIGAVSFLKYLKDNEYLDIDDGLIGLFAGIGFQRTYRYHHIEDSFVDAAKSDFKKLFLAFTYLKPEKIIDLEAGEKIFAEDFFGFDAGVFGKVPTPWYLTLQAAAMKGFNRTRSIDFYSYGADPSNPNKKVLKSTLKITKGNAQGFFADLVLDVFKIFNLTLLSFNISSDFSKTSTQEFSFYQKDLDSIKSGELHKPFKDLIKRKEHLADGLLSHKLSNWKETIKKSGTRKYQSIKGGFANEIEEKKYINFNKSGHEETFNASIEKFLYVKSIWKDLTNNVSRNLRKIVAKIPYLKDYTDLLSYLTIPKLDIARFAKMQEVNIDYKSSSNLSTNEGQYPKNAKGENLKIKLNKYIATTKTNTFLDVIYKKIVLSFVEEQTKLKGDIKSNIQLNMLRGPFEIESEIEISPDGLKQFSKTLEWDVEYLFSEICLKRSYLTWKKTKQNKKCVKKVMSLFSNFKNYNAKSDEFHVDQLKDLVDVVYQNASTRQLNLLFGEENLKIKGELKGKTNKGKSFRTVF